MFAKYKKPLFRWLLLWCFWLVLTGSSWPRNERYSPLLWPNVWGLIDWLGSSAIFVALWVGSGYEFGRELPKQSRIKDIVMLLYFLARGFALVALLFVIAAVRIALYRQELHADLRGFYMWRPEPAVLHLPFLLCTVAIVPAAFTFVFGTISIVFRKYDKLDPLTQR